MGYRLLNAAFGIFRGASKMEGVNKFGRSIDVDTVERDIWDVAATLDWVAPTQARIHDIASTSANDAYPSGTGARKIKIFGLTSWSTAEVSEEIELNGLNNVPTVNAYVIIHRMRVLNKGSADVNVGDISATAQTDGTVTAQINAGQGQTQMAIYGVPSNRAALMTSYWGAARKSAGVSADVDLSLMVNPEPDQELTNYIRKHTQGSLAAGTSSVQQNFLPYLVIPGPAIIKMRAVSSANNTDVSAGFDLYLARQ